MKTRISGVSKDFSEYYEEKILPVAFGEARLHKREGWESLVKQLLPYDIISFDVFDTLIFRFVSHPGDVFYLMGMELFYPDFRRIRMEAEQRARKQKYKVSHTFEVTLWEIWQVLERESGIPAEKGIQTELAWEKRACFANPYMLQVVRTLQSYGKKIILTSDMYLDKKQILNLLEICGYNGLKDCFVSCDYGVSKGNGMLYERILDTYGKNLRYVHVGDNLEADFQQAQEHSIKGIYYKNVNTLGNAYRSMDMSLLTGSIYRGLVNSHLHSGWKVYTREYEYGYVYGGLFVTGYCRFIHEYVKKNQIEKVLFLSRDGYLLRKAYLMLYPKEEENTAYVLWSRSAALKITAGKFRYEYFRRFLFHKAGQGFSIRQVLKEMDLFHLEEDLCRKKKVRLEEKLTYRNAVLVKEYLTDNWSEVLQAYQEQIHAGGIYFRSILSGCKSAAAVDIGWVGSGAVMLDHAVNSLWNLSCPVTGILAGTNSRHCFEADAGEGFLFQGKLVSYLYSQGKNRDIWKYHDPSKGHNLYWELLLGAPKGGLRGFHLKEDGSCRPEVKNISLDVRYIREIHKGALDFVRQILETEERLGMQIPISGRDAYSPMISALSRRNAKEMEVFQELLDDAFVN